MIRLFVNGIIYFTVSISALFFTMWFLTSTSIFSSFAGEFVSEDQNHREWLLASQDQGSPNSLIPTKVENKGSAISIQNPLSQKERSNQDESNPKEKKDLSVPSPPTLPSSIGPMAPSSPTGPVAPSPTGPMAPSSPTGPVAPSSPTGGPVAPSSPTGGPVAPSSPTGGPVAPSSLDLPSSAPIDLSSESESNIPPPPSVSSQEEEKQPNQHNLNEDLNKILKRAGDLQNIKGTVSSELATKILDLGKQIEIIYGKLEVYNYDEEEDKRNPFSRVTKKPEPQSKTDVVEQEVPVQEEQNWDTKNHALNQLHLLAIRWDENSENFAWFKGPNGNTYEVMENERIGNNYGVVYKIRKKDVIILEPRYGWRSDLPISADEEIYDTVIIPINRKPTF